MNKEPVLWGKYIVRLLWTSQRLFTNQSNLRPLHSNQMFLVTDNSSFNVYTIFLIAMLFVESLVSELLSPFCTSDSFELLTMWQCHFTVILVSFRTGPLTTVAIWHLPGASQHKGISVQENSCSVFFVASPRKHVFLFSLSLKYAFHHKPSKLPALEYSLCPPFPVFPHGSLWFYVYQFAHTFLVPVHPQEQTIKSSRMILRTWEHLQVCVSFMALSVSE